MKKTTITEIICFLFIVLFVYAAASKWLVFDKFSADIGKSPLLTVYPAFVAWFIPLLEITIAVLLTVKRTQLPALYASFTLMVIFTAYIISILHFSYYIPCSCGGILQNMSWQQHLYFNMGFVLLGATGILLYPSDQRAIAIDGKAENR